MEDHIRRLWLAWLLGWIPFSSGCGQFFKRYQDLKAMAEVKDKQGSEEDPDRPSVVKIQAADECRVVTVGMPTIWLTYSYAKDWHTDALREARILASHDARRREIIFAVCVAESYLFEWVRDEVLSRNFTLINTYFPPGLWRPLPDRWKEVTNRLREDGRIRAMPVLDEPFWEDFQRLVTMRNGLVHARSSRPETRGLPDEQRPFPSKTDLDSLEAGWPARVVLTLITKFHEANGSRPPDWLVAP